MRLKQYINEGKYNSPEQLRDQLAIDGIDIESLKKFRKDCGYEPLFRGSQRVFEGYRVLKSHLDDRRPKDTPPVAHDKLNEMFYKRFRWNVRNGVFVSANEIDTQTYGIPSYFYPIGKYDFCWSREVRDLNDMGSISSLIVRLGDVKAMDKMLFEIKHGMLKNNPYFSKYRSDTLPQFIENAKKNIEKLIKTYQNTDLEAAVKHQHEISFKCDEYILSYYDIPEQLK